jgi:hypothetical protein
MKEFSEPAVSFGIIDIRNQNFRLFPRLGFAFHISVSLLFEETSIKTEICCRSQN